MDEYFNSKKYVILLIIVCLLFAMLILKSFDYLPKPDNIPPAQYSTEESSVNYTKDSDKENNANRDDSDDNNTSADENDYDDDYHKSGHIDFEKNAYPDKDNFEEFPAPKGINEETVQTYDIN